MLRSRCQSVATRRLGISRTEFKGVFSEAGVFSATATRRRRASVSLQPRVSASTDMCGRVPWISLGFLRRSPKGVISVAGFLATKCRRSKERVSNPLQYMISLGTKCISSKMKLQRLHRFCQMGLTEAGLKAVLGEASVCNHQHPPKRYLFLSCPG